MQMKENLVKSLGWTWQNFELLIEQGSGQELSLQSQYLRRGCLVEQRHQMFLSWSGQGGTEALEHREQSLLLLTEDLQALRFLSVVTHFCSVGTIFPQKALML